MFESCKYCKRSLEASDAGGMASRRYECAQTNHVVASDLALTGEVSLDTIVWIIGSCTGNRNRASKTRSYLIRMGIPAHLLFSKFGYDKTRDTYLGRAIKDEEVCHLGFTHYWLLAAKQRIGNLHPAAVVYIENDCRLSRPVSEIVSLIQHTRSPLLWLGYDNKPAPGRHGKLQIGSIMMAFTGVGLQDALRISLHDRPKRRGSKVWRHLDLMFWDDCADSIEWDSPSCCTSIPHVSTVTGFWRPGKSKRVLRPVRDAVRKKPSGVNT